MRGTKANPSSLAPLAGFLVFAGVLLLAHVLIPQPPPGLEDLARPRTRGLLASLTFWLLAAAIGSYVAARLYPRNPVRSSLAAAAGMGLLVGADWLATLRFGGEPGWWHALLILGVFAVSVLLGRVAETQTEGAKATHRPSPDSAGVFRVATSFNLEGRGPVLVGEVESGTVRVGSRLQVPGAGDAPILVKSVEAVDGPGIGHIGLLFQDSATLPLVLALAPGTEIPFGGPPEPHVGV